jgi:hypothetical protein
VISTTDQNHDLIRRMTIYGLPKAIACQIVVQFQYWRDNSNDEWVAGHIKALKVNLIRYMGGLPPIRSKWIAWRRDNVTPTGAFGALWKISKRQPYTALNCIMIYSTLLYSQKGKEVITPAQLKDFEEAVNRPDISPDAVLAYADLLDQMPMEWHSPVPPFSAPAILDIPVKPFKASPVPLHGMRRKEQVFPAALSVLSHNPEFYLKHKTLLDTALGELKSLVPPALDEDIDEDDEAYSGVPNIYHRMVVGEGIERNAADVIAGTVRFIQDSGYKLRHIFVTNELLQIASLPLQEFLMSELRHLPQDATYDQDAGIHSLQSLIRDGETVHCFDLQKCSDNLPRLFQIMLFRKLGLTEDWISWFSDITSSKWEVIDRIPDRWNDGTPSDLLNQEDDIADEQGSSFIRLSVGQQLGFGPSFPAFALGHHSIIRGLARKHHRPLVYGLLGDDLWIKDSILATKYLEFMALAGVPISSTKTIISNRIAEFAGKVILPDKVISTYKWKGKSSDNNFLDIAAVFGPRSLDLFRPRQRFIAEVMGMIPSPIGLGWNQDGESWIDRYERTSGLIDLLEQEKDIRIRHFTSRTEKANRIIYGDASWTRGYTLPRISDLEIIPELLVHYPALFHEPLLRALLLQYPGLALPNVDYLARLLDIGSLNGKDIVSLLTRSSWIEKVSKLSQLTIMERKLRLDGFDLEKRLESLTRRSR